MHGHMFKYMVKPASKLDVFLTLHLVFLRQDLSLNLQLTNSARLAGKQAAGVLFLPTHTINSWDSGAY